MTPPTTTKGGSHQARPRRTGEETDVEQLRDQERGAGCDRNPRGREHHRESHCQHEARINHPPCAGRAEAAVGKIRDQERHRIREGPEGEVILQARKGDRVLHQDVGGEHHQGHGGERDSEVATVEPGHECVLNYPRRRPEQDNAKAPRQRKTGGLKAARVVPKRGDKAV
jgi:hypothetical protein